MAPKLEDLLKYDLSKTGDSYEDVCKIIEKVFEKIFYLIILFDYN
jgi:hypothetical protein